MSVAARVNVIAWNKLVKQLAGASDKRVQVGLLAGAGGERTHPESGLTMIELAAIHEFGSPRARIPERSFLRATANRSEVIRRAALIGARLMKRQVEGKIGVDAALGQLGAFLATEIRNTIRRRMTEGPEPQANAPSTIARKGSSTPLVDTGRLINAITWLIVDKKK